MTDARVTVGIPIGPGYSREWLEEAIASVDRQSVATRILIVDDMATGVAESIARDGRLRQWPGTRKRTNAGLPWIRSYITPWLLGVASAFNHCIAMSDTDLVFMLGHDDYLAPTCVERCLAVYDRAPTPWQAQHAYYYVPLQYLDTGEIQRVPCNAAMVHKQLWADTGGFPPETGSGAPDAAFISRAMVAPETGFPAILQPVESEEPLYFYRRHPGTDTARRGPWQNVILETRHILTRTFEPPQWGRP